MNLNFTEDQIIAMVESAIKTQIEDTIMGIDVEQIIEQEVCSRLEKKFESQYGLEELIEKVCVQETSLWMSNNIYKEDLMKIISKAIMNKMDSVPLEKLIEMAELLKG